MLFIENILIKLTKLYNTKNVYLCIRILNLFVRFSELIYFKFSN